MGITPQKLRAHLMQAVKESVGNDKAPKRHTERKLRNHTSDGSTEYDPSEEIEAMGIKYTRGRERYWRSLGKKIAKGSRIR